MCGAFLDLLEYTANMNEKLRDHLTNATGARNTSKDIQNNLLDSIYEVYLAQVESELSSSEFVSMQSNETTEVACASQLAMVLRNMKFGRPVERFHGFVTVDDRSAVGISAEYSTIVQHKGKINCASILWSSSNERITQWRAEGSDKTRVSPGSFFALLRPPTQLGCQTNEF